MTFSHNLHVRERFVRWHGSSSGSGELVTVKLILRDNLHSNEQAK
jgi:hypothetical protein